MLKQKIQFHFCKNGRALKMNKKRKFDIVSLEKFHLKNLAKYLNSHFLDNDPVEFWLNRFENWWFKNPYQISSDPMGWIITSPEGIHGFIGSFNSKLSIKGEPTIIKNITTWSVNEEAKHYSLKLLNSLILAFPNSLIFCTTGTEDVTKILKAYKFQSYLHKNDIHSSVIPISPSNTLFFKTINNAFNIPLISSVERGITSFLLSTFIYGNSKSLHHKVMTKNDLPEIQKLWKNLKSHYELTTWRDEEYFNWHCFEDQSFFKILIGIYEETELVALGTMVHLDKKIQIFECRDFFTNPNKLKDNKLIHAAVKAFIKIGRQHSMDLVSIPEDCGLIEIPSSIRQHRGHNNRLFKIRNDFLSDEQITNAFFTNQGDIYI